ncbi:hypothetical protein HOD75_02965 [archaeon]|jgi:hypothetical protein|nr:hypothetical protein [Candidatus Woesearchaeota archaeon]MBT4135612.1 hypothetical protein [archaeon]MBT4241835.1 hypothetical protein [archaeon]MBT4418383.1 hypothetical protein [archaeon]
MENINQEILNKLNQIQIDINILKGDKDSNNVLTSEEEEEVDKAVGEYQRGESISLDEIKRERENAQLEI